MSLMKRIKRCYNNKIQPTKQAMPRGRFTIVKVLMTDGLIFEARVDAPRGSPMNPLSRKELEQKLRQAVADEERMKSLLQSIKQLTTLQQVAPLFANL
jgi:2-methylcitrate dehydratase PrpD